MVKLTPARTTTRPPAVLVADDEVEILHLVTSLMETEGYLVFPASDGHEALELSRGYKGTIDLVITDVEMPRLNGTDLCSHLLEERPGIKVMMMSGQDLDELRCRNVPGPLLVKPFDCQVLQARVRELLARRESP